MRFFPLLTALTLGLSISFTAQAGFSDFLEGLFGGGDKNSQPQQQNKPSSSGKDQLANALLSQLSEEDAVKGLKEALAQGVNKSITTLGTSNGFWGNEDVKIPLPKEAQKLAKAVKKLGGDSLVDNFHQTINQAAENAVPHVADTFSEAIRAMSIQDGIAIVKGNDTAATDFFKRTTSDKLTGLIKPLVARATNEAGLTAYYKQLTDQLGPMAAFVAPQGLDLDQYVTDKTLEGLFKTIGKEEAQIRANPKDQGKEILQRVFGAI